MAKLRNGEVHEDFEIRQAGLADVDDIAAAHVDSIHSLGPQYYGEDVVREWAAGLDGKLYAQAMARGEVFFVAVSRAADASEILGFSTHRVDDGVHGTAVYVRGKAARSGIGSALFRTAEAAARAAGAVAIQIDASLAAVDFYRANGFEEMGRGHHALPSGASMACVVMRKEL